MIRVFSILWIAITPIIASAQEDRDLPADQLLLEAYELEQKNLRDSAILFFEKAAVNFKKESNWQKYIECIAGENRNYLKTDQIGNVANNGIEAIEIIDAGKTDENDEYVIEILTQLSRYNWYAKGNFPESLKYLDRAIKICGQVEFDISKRKVQIYTDYGYTYGYSGDFDNSEKYFQDALELALEVYEANSEIVADRYTDLVFPLIQKSEWEKAEIAQKKATELNIKIRGPEHIAVMKNYNNLGYIYMEKFDHDQAILYITKAIDMIRARFGENHRSIGIGYMNLGASYSNRGDFKTGLKYSKMAIENFKISIGDKSPYIGISLLNIGNEYNHMGIYDSAEMFYNEALKFKIGLYGTSHHEIVNMYTYLTEFYLSTKNYAQAFSFANEALKIASAVLPEKHKHSGNSHLALSNCFAAVQQYEESLDQVQLAIIGLIPNFNDKNPGSNPDLNQDIISTRILIEALIHKTKILKEYYDENNDGAYLNMAYQTAVVVDKALDILRIEYQTPASKEVLLSRSKDFYENALEVIFQLYQQNKTSNYLQQAFNYFEKSKSILLIENVKSNSDFAEKSLPDSIAIEEKSLSRAIAFYKEKIFDAKTKNDTTALSSLENDFFRNKRDYDLLLNYIEENYPDYYTIKHSIFNASLQAAQNRLDDQTALIEYFYGKKGMYTLAITNQEVFYNKIPQSEIIEAELSKILKGFEKKQFDAAASHSIFDTILRSIIEKNALAGINKLTFIPDGILHYLPFEILVTSNIAAGQIRYLIQDYTINYFHSATLPELYQHRASNQLSYLGFSPGYNKDSNPLLASRSARDVQIAGMLEKLPMAEEEVKTSATIWNGDSYTDNDATEENFKSLAEKAGIIHIASHTIIDDEDPMNSKLVFSPGADTLEDGLLHTYELYNMELNAQLACLSACNTGFGQIRSGEGVVSLAKGFFYAGVPNVLMSLWSVPDKSTSEIMTQFYEELKKGQGKADALRNAKLKYLKSSDSNTSDPYYWAAFTMIGDNRPIEKQNNLLAWILGVALIVFAGAAVIIKRNSI